MEKLMTYLKAILSGTALLAAAACTNLTPQQNTTLGAVAGAGAGILAADAFDANDNWTVVSTLAGAAAGTLVAQNRNGETCAYARGDGTYYRASCP